MTQSLTSYDALLVTIVLATLAIGLPILFVLSIRFLWDRKMNLGRSRELEKLIWQLHRIASAMEHQMNLSLPPAQTGTEKPGDPADARQLAPQSTAPVRAGAASAAEAESAAHEVRAEQPSTASPAAPREPSPEGDRSGGVNSMFGL
jgi:uncharacterized membrane protein